MIIPVPVLLILLALPACQGHVAARLQTSIFLKESIRLLNELLKTKEYDDMETLCKATTVAWEGRSCHRHLEGIYLNLLSLVQRKSPAHKAPCPVAAGNTTSLNDFLVDLRRVLQRLVKD